MDDPSLQTARTKLPILVQRIVKTLFWLVGRRILGKRSVSHFVSVLFYQYLLCVKCRIICSRNHSTQAIQCDFIHSKGVKTLFLTKPFVSIRHRATGLRSLESDQALCVHIQQLHGWLRSQSRHGNTSRRGQVYHSCWFLSECCAPSIDILLCYNK